MARELDNSVESGKNKYFLNLFITLPNGKKVKIGMTTLDWNLEKGSKAQKAFTKALINKFNEKGGLVNVKGLSATFVIAGDVEEDQEDVDFSSMFD